MAALPEVFEAYATAVRGAANEFAEAFETIAGKPALKEVGGLAVDRLGYGNFVRPTLVQPTKNSVLGASRCITMPAPILRDAFRERNVG